jgi:uncharacterized protein DUF6884
VKPYRERMEQEAARLRAALRRLETTSGQHRAVAPDFQGIRRAHGAWVTVRRFDQARYDTLARELRAVEARLAAALAAPPGGRRLVVLVGCVATKRPAELDERGIARRWPAADVYTSPLWARRRAYAERQAPGAWAILSARHGLLRPDQPIAPYDATLAELTPRERQGWAHSCARAVLDHGPAHALRVEVHAGELYWRGLAAELERAGVEVALPVRGLAIGQQLQWYRQQEEHAAAARAATSSPTPSSPLTLKCQNEEDAAMPQPTAAQAPAGADVARTTSQLLAALEACWAAIRRQHPEVPAAVLVVAAGSDRRQGLFKWGHYARLRWRPRPVEGAGGGGAAALPEVLVAGEGLERPALEVMGTLVHEAAHAVADVRQLQDTSRDGRYHNRRYRQVAEELGLEVEEMAPYGHARTTMRPQTAARYAAQVEELAAALVLYRVAEAAPQRRRRTTAAGDEDGQGQDDGTRAGEDLDDDQEDDDERGRRRDYNLVPALCACGRRLRIARSVLAAGPITCGLCGADFEAVEPDDA